MEAAVAWAYARRGRADPTRAAHMDDDLIQQFADLGIAVEVDEVDEDAILIPVCNFPALAAFRACETQWRVVGTFAGLFWLGLDYAGCRVVLDHLKSPPGVFDDLRIMEAAALEHLNETD